ncbi:hypothetical protein VW23_012385 [Devosia insulae DS-56]|uniref:ATP-grasp domain-containing protein n=1 Tax=Devosia insulae DS-56 TaxID=1116389 RepID=A0A1E5XUI8_9HYPH|nr:hypothetical protein [Devosia insulae]OEO32235.1 hypothetical protein VW23_012385 [Devosia insulae DS-56]
MVDGPASRVAREIRRRLKNNDVAGARARIEYFRGQWGDVPAMLLAEGQCDYHEGNFAAAMFAARKYADWVPGSAVAQLLLAAAAKGLGDKESACRHSAAYVAAATTPPPPNSDIVVADLSAGFAINRAGEATLESGANNLVGVLEGEGWRPHLAWSHLLHHADWGASLGNAALVISGITDSDLGESQLVELEQAAMSVSVKVINGPSAVRASRRDRVAATRVAGVIVPPVVRQRGRFLRTAALQPWEPQIIRLAGSHNGHDTWVIDSEASWERFLHALDGDAFYYISPYVETVQRDGLRRKARIYSIFGKVMAEHLVLDHAHIVHTGTARRAMLASQEQVDEELEFIDRWVEEFPQIVPLMNALQAQTGLDIFMADIGLLETGEIALYEANCSMRVILKSELTDEGCHLADATARIRQAIVEGLAARRTPRNV